LRPTRRVAALLGFLAKGEVYAIFQQLPYQPADPAADPLDFWRKSSDGRGRLPPLPEGQPVALPDAAAPAVEAVKQRPAFRRFYESVADYQFGMVPVAALLSPQWHADLDYVDELAGRLADAPDACALVRFAMPEGAITEPIVHGNQVVFTSPRPDLNVANVPDVRPTADGGLEIVMRASSRPNYLQVAVLEDGRLFLVNGVHKALALYRRGHRQIPCVWRKVHRLEEAGCNMQSSMFGDPTFKGPRPARVLDFLDGRVAVPVVMPSTYQVIRVTALLEQFQVPAVRGVA
jgi:hypothetical protein